MSAALAVVADDLTGACDLAGEVRAHGWSARVHVGVPDAAASAEPADCRVVALKSRTADAGFAASESARAARSLLVEAPALLYQKYCSTFDSTERGNIGPIADALAAVARVGTLSALTVGTPATPAVGRTQYRGHLFVGDTLLSESSMRSHPLTPMRDSDLPRVLAAQTPARVMLVRHASVRAGGAALRDALAAAAEQHAGHTLVDATCDADLDAIAAALLDAPSWTPRPVVATGAAGLAAAVARVSGPRRKPGALPAVPDGGRLIISGSASAATRSQLAAFDGPRLEVDPLVLAGGDREVAALAARLSELLADAEGAPVLVAAAGGPERVAAAQAALGAEAAARLIEDAFAVLARHAVSEASVTRLIVAGGETSGAVVAGLGVRELEIGATVEPGLPWTVGAPAEAGSRLALLLKSGNFGGSDLFASAWRRGP